MRSFFPLQSRHLDASSTSPPHPGRLGLLSRPRRCLLRSRSRMRRVPFGRWKYHHLGLHGCGWVTHCILQCVAWFVGFALCPPIVGDLSHTLRALSQLHWTERPAFACPVPSGSLVHPPVCSISHQALLGALSSPSDFVRRSSLLHDSVVASARSPDMRTGSSPSGGLSAPSVNVRRRRRP